MNKTSQHIRDEIVETRREGFSCGHNKWRISRREIYILTQLLLDYRQLPILHINALKEESKIGISASKRNVAPQRGRSWTGLGVFLEDSKNLKLHHLQKD
ncbi:hypothetical protein [Peribacillus frigoritolerans]|uniref:Uncharacterized protein n=1 Tax=Peribacillus castrilensis TaxID=2897690 RepID=A0AAW9ND67_9BACI|nr:hypothetical protein [Peribacillus castrilensis]